MCGSGLLSLAVYAEPAADKESRNELIELLKTLPNPRAHIDYWEVEDAEARARLPKFKTIHGTPAEELSQSSGPFERSEHLKWERSHGDSNSIRYSGHDQINKSNVHQLEQVWDLRTTDGEEGWFQQATQGNPIFVNGLVITHSVDRSLIAVDPATGDEVWRFQPDDHDLKTGATGRRGFVFYPGNEKLSERLFFGVGHFLVAVSSKTGKPIETFGAKGKINLGGGDVRPAGAVYENTLVVTNMAGFVLGLDVSTGKELWEYSFSPGPGEYGYETWDKIDHEPGTRLKTGVSSWGGMALDEERGLAYFATSSPKPNYVGAQHRGQNLLSNSVVCIDVKTGKRVWDFQELRHDIWDMEPAAPPMLVSFDHEGHRVDAVAQVTKMGNTLLLDRETGRPVHDFRLRRAPTSTVPGEKTWPYQPHLELPEPFIDQEFTREDITTITPEAKAFVEAQIDSGAVKLGWMEPPGINFNSVTALYGGVNWPGGCFDPETGLLYIGVNHTPTLARVKPQNFTPPTQAEWKPEIQMYQTYCAACHNQNYQGVGVAPGLVGTSESKSLAEIIEIITKGKGSMPPMGMALGKEKTEALAKFVHEGLALDNDPTSRARRPAYKRLQTAFC